jgi:hypothetical protein
VVGRDADDRARQQAAPLQPVEGVEGHHAREVTGDSEADQHIGLARIGPV